MNSQALVAEMPNKLEGLFRLPLEIPKKALDIMDLIDKAKEKGLTNQIDRLKDWGLATILDTQKIGLLSGNHYETTYTDSIYVLAKMDTEDGEWKGLNNGGFNCNWNETPLLDYGRYIPSQIIDRIPKELISDAMVFYAKVDPIIAIRVREPKIVTTTKSSFFGTIVKTKTSINKSGKFLALYRWD